MLKPVFSEGYYRVGPSLATVGGLVYADGGKEISVSVDRVKNLRIVERVGIGAGDARIAPHEVAVSLAGIGGSPIREGGAAICGVTEAGETLAAGAAEEEGSFKYAARVIEPDDHIVAATRHRSLALCESSEGGEIQIARRIRHGDHAGWQRLPDSSRASLTGHERGRGEAHAHRVTYIC